ncbi:MAG TPA: hypothetical protein PLD10_25405 [Rhodopila sp.]|nr:hypothetical protein [Rhodopila sp.]
MWNQPYLETCCRAALHRLYLAGQSGRPGDVPDAGCLRRLASMGLCEHGQGGWFVLNQAGRVRHATEVLADQPTAAVTSPMPRS